MSVAVVGLTYEERIQKLRDAKLKQTAEKRAVIGHMDYDDWAIILPPVEMRETVKLIGASGAPITDVKIAGLDLESNHPSGGFFGAEMCGRNYRKLLEMHPVYIDPMSSLAGAYMVNFFSYRSPHWNPDLDLSQFAADVEKYHLKNGIGGVQHFCQDLSIGLELGWGGLAEKIDRYASANGESDLYSGLRHVISGVQDWILRHAERASALAACEENPFQAENLREIEQMNRHLVDGVPRTFREACQWVLWFQLISRMYDGSGSLGAIDRVLLPFYLADSQSGILSDEDAVFHIACLLVRDTGYSQLGGYDDQGNDTTNALSYLVLDAIEMLDIPANIGVSVGRQVDPGLLKRGVEIQFDHKNGIPKFLGVDNTAEGFARNGYGMDLGYNRIYAGCHWCAVPGREYTMNDLIKINLARVFEVAFAEYWDSTGPRSVAGLWSVFADHLRHVVEVIARGIDYHMEHMHEVFPELVMDLLCHGPIERGLDVANGGVDLYNIGVDAAGLSVAADSFAALEQRVEKERSVTWDRIGELITTDWDGPEGERARLLMKQVPRYGVGGTPADDYAVRVSSLFTQLVIENSTPAGYRMIPGLFSWALAPYFGGIMGATPDGRRAGDPIAHGSNPSPGFSEDGASTAIARAVAAVQPGYGQTAPLQLDFDPGLSKDERGAEAVEAIVRTHFDLGGSQINLNVMDAKKVLEAYEDPLKYPDLVVRVTGFSAYFANLSPSMRKLVVDRVIDERRTGD